MLSRFPAAFRQPAFASWASLPARDFRPPYGRPTAPPASGADPDRFSVFRTRETRLDLGALCTPGGGGARTAGDRPRPPPAASQRPAPVTLDCDPSQDVMITRHQQGFTVVHPTPAFPSPVTPDGTGILGLSPELHTQLSRTQQRMSGRGRAWTLPGLRPWHQPASFDALTHHVRPHVAAINHHVAGAVPTPRGPR